MALPQLNTSRYNVYVPGLGKEVSFRPYLVKEEKILMIAMESNDQKQILGAITDIIKSCVFDDINVDNLAVFDVELLFIHLRQKSVGEGINVSLKCSECDTSNQADVDLDLIEVPVITDDDKTVMLNDDVGVTMRYPSFKDIKKFKPEELEKAEGIIALMKECIVNIFDGENIHEKSDITKKELDDFIDGMNSTQFTTLAGFFNEMPTLKTDLSFTCTNCGHENVHEVRGLQNFFT